MTKMSKRGHERYEKITQVALELFLEKGYENTSLNDIIDKSGGSLASIYKFFKNKEGLFKAIVDKSIDEFCNEIDEKIDLKLSHKLEDFLHKFATVFFDIICERKTTYIARTMIIEGFKNDSALGKMFLEQILNKIHKILVDFFNRDEIKAKLSDIDADLAASLFCALVRSPYHYNAVLLNSDIALSKQQREEHVKICVDLFLNGVCKSKN